MICQNNIAGFYLAAAVCYINAKLVSIRDPDYTFFSKTEAFLIGLLGTFLINLLRITLTVILLVVARPLFAVVFHDYLAAIVTIVWLIVFWWFAYAFVLDEKQIKPAPKPLLRPKKLFARGKKKKVNEK